MFILPVRILSCVLRRQYRRRKTFPTTSCYTNLNPCYDCYLFLKFVPISLGHTVYIFNLNISLLVVPKPELMKNFHSNIRVQNYILSVNFIQNCTTFNLKAILLWHIVTEGFSEKNVYIQFFFKNVLFCE